jgi:outer membrane lipoprotein carrier protein
MQKILLNTVLLMMSFSVLAQGDPAAKKILDEVSAKFKTYKTVQASFSYKVENASNKVMGTPKQGTIWMKGAKYKIAFAGQEIFSDGTTVWNYDKSNKTVTINNADANSKGITPQKLFTNFYDKDFLSLLNGEKKVGAKTLLEIEMTPVDKSKNFQKVYLLIDKSTKSMYSTRALMDTGEKYTWTVSSMKTNGVMGDDTFVFDKKKYPGVVEDDIR